jgi:nucleoside-diphosphate-sugar epimerase
MSVDVFLTGGSGFLGQHIISRLIADGHTVRALARSPQAAQRVTRAGARPVRGDLTDLVDPDPATTTWLSELRGSDAVIHAAAYMEFWGPDAEFERANHRPTMALHTAAAAADVKRFVLISAALVSTDGRREPEVVDETTRTGRSILAYGRVKLATEQALSNETTPGMALVILRPPFIWGLGMATIGQFAAAIEAGQFAWIDEGRHIMDFVHVDNVAAASSAALTKGRDRGIYYITDGTPSPIRDFLGPLLDTQGIDTSTTCSVPLGIATPIARVLDGTARLLRRRTAPPLTNWLIAFMGRNRSYDITSARNELDYRPEVSLTAGLDEMRAEAADKVG